jgi:SAM-dependent methyltransferase
MTSPSHTIDGWQLEASSADAYEQYLGSAFAPWAGDLVALADVREGERVLDVACGTGIVARQAVSRVGTAGLVVGLDVNEDMLSVARRTSAAATIEWRQANAAALPFSNGTFDVVCCEQAIQFFPDPVKCLGEMRRVLRDTGRAAVSVCRPIRYSPAYATLADALERHVGPEAGAMMRSPFSAWSVDEFRGLFSAAGFARTRVRIDVWDLRYPSVAEFLRREAASSPLAGLIRVLNDDARRDLVRDLEVRLAERVDDEGVSCAIEVYVALASAEIR